MTDNSIFILVPFWIFVILFIINEIKRPKRLKSSSDSRTIWWTLPLLFFGVLIRTIYLQYPFGVHLDEAINGYESWCLAHYGVDQHLSSYPVYFKSWGSGQSTLYAYLSIPFVKLFGLNSSSYRLVMGITSSISLMTLYYTLRKTKQDNFFILIVVLLFALNPWHIMKSRWALDCNLSPDMILIGACLFMLGYYAIASYKKTIYYIFGSLFLVLAAYSYGINWFMLPIFTLLLIAFFYKKKQMSISQIAISLLTMMVLLLPLIAFAIQLVTKGDPYQIGAMTIPQLDSSRHEATTIFGSTEPFGMFRHYMKRAAILLFWGQDNLGWNSFGFFGQFYNILGIPFVLISFINMFIKRNLNFVDRIFLIWLVSMLPILFFVEPNVNHWNALWFPLTYFFAKGLYIIVENSKVLKKTAIISIILLSIGFGIKYITSYKKESSGTEVDKIINFAYSLNVDTIYNPGFSSATTLFYHPISPYSYSNTVVNSDRVFENVKSYEKNRFELPKVIYPTSRTAYIVPNSQIERFQIDQTKFKKWDGGSYSIFWNE